MSKTVQFFSDEYLKECRKMTATQILGFLEDYRLLHSTQGQLQQINMRVPKNILKAFKSKAKREGVLYQQKIRELMVNWALE